MLSMEEFYSTYAAYLQINILKTCLIGKGLVKPIQHLIQHVG